MSPPLTRVIALYVGQGMAHLVEVYYDGSKYPAKSPDVLALIDFGGDQDVADDAVTYVVNQLKAQARDKRTPTFGLTVISHQDKDHLILLKPLTAAILAAGLDISFGTVFLGGLVWSNANKKVVDDFFGVSRLRPRYAWDTAERSDYDGATKRSEVKRLLWVGNTYFRILVSQLRAAGGPDIKKNASSCVLVIENGENSIVLPADATWQTMQYVNALYDDWGTAPLVPTVRALEVPHHGALRTAVENYKASDPISKFGFDVINAFAKNCSAPSVFASAGRYNNHGHPVKEVLDVFKPYVGPDVMHTIVAWLFTPTVKGVKTSKSIGYREIATSRNIWTTLTKLDGSYGNIEYSMKSSAAGEPAEPPRIQLVSLRELSAMQNRARGLPVDEAPSSPLSSAAQPPAPVFAAAPTDEERAAAARLATLPRRR
jgi:hypothetical protein